MIKVCDYVSVRVRTESPNLRGEREGYYGGERLCRSGRAAAGACDGLRSAKQVYGGVVIKTSISDEGASTLRETLEQARLVRGGRTDRMSGQVAIAYSKEAA